MIGVFVPREVSFKLGQDVERRRIREIVEKRRNYGKSCYWWIYDSILAAIARPAERCPTTDASASEQSGQVSRVDSVGSPDAQQDFFRCVSAEIDRARAKWPDGSILHRLAALTGEVGELAEGVLKQRPIEELEHEAVQVAAMAYRAAAALAARPQEPNDD